MAVNGISDKVELHVHLDGSIRINTILDIAKKKGISLPARTEDDLKKHVTVWERPGDFDKALGTFAVFMPVIAGDREAIWRTAYEFCEDCSKEKICYVEARYAPHFLANDLPKPTFALKRGDLGAREVVKIVIEAFKKGSHDFDITVNSILCCAIHEPDWSKEVLALCDEFRNEGVVGMDLACGEIAGPDNPRDREHIDTFQEGYKRGIHRTVHAGEIGTAQTVRMSVELMHAERIGHGYHVIDDPAIYEQIKQTNVHFEVCPNSAQLTGVIPVEFDDPLEHAALRFAQDGVSFSINRDDPLVFQNTLDDDFMLLQGMGLTVDQSVVTIFNAAHSAFISPIEKQKLLSRLETSYGKR